MSMLRTALVAAFAATEVAASCAYGTPLMPRAEEGEVPVNTFGYSGTIVCYTSHSEFVYIFFCEHSLTGLHKRDPQAGTC